MAVGKCTPEQMAACPLQKHFTDTHHLYYPRGQYTRPVEKIFRELPENKVQLCRNEHNEIHATEPIPEKPTRQEMFDTIAKVVTALGAEVL